MTAGYSNKPLIKKLGIKSGMSVMPVNEPEHYFELLGELPGKVKLVRKSNPDPVDFIHLFAPDERTLHNQLPPLKLILKKKGMLWVSWIKKSSRRETDISESDVRNLGLELGLVDVKICAVDEDWSALKFMQRKKD
ncbi:MAG: hypothetical protein U5K69_11060 [Balneolaceae bacterium]|nr:hypothetical protein [Balneolaceae bacterium]